ncbi:alpha/beta fold hydrolase [Alteromonas pelagimontana]|uniref:Alpha/beta fold hydrolase n=1 Tax=Alteromonas pelagimontana TaxID=1858656 RepID=A0A6M4MC16_9ALTE|nr:alpha/beta fold hydrolase [Alteromonas pelagimontana]QJR79686.1 alpha/beta fold hydrolase [Alteromonas pelagimontana]
MFSYIREDAEASQALLLLAHGAGAGKSSAFIEEIASLLVARRIAVIRFDFPYMQQMTDTGKRRPPDSSEKLQAHFVALCEQMKREFPMLPVFLGGKSMGGRIATTILGNTTTEGAVVFGYPFHPPGKPEKLRTAHLETLTKPVKIIQGSRDTFGSQEECKKYDLSPAVSVNFLTDGDHSLKPRKASGFTHQQHLEQAADLTAEFILSWCKK